jgi:mesencephalic astrocyte-derived neurotrophic factor
MPVAIKVEKKEGEEVNYQKMRVKALKSILADRGVKCTGCTEKNEFVKKCQETEHLEM